MPLFGLVELMLKLEVNWLKTEFNLDAFIVLKGLISVLTYGRKRDLEDVLTYIIKFGILSGIANKRSMLL